MAATSRPTSARQAVWPLALVIATLAAEPPVVRAEPGFDHAHAIATLGETDRAEGERIYQAHCVSCHGADGTAVVPLARSFNRDPLKYGADPYALWRTLSFGNGQMFRYDGILAEKDRYQVIHYIREALIRPDNPSQYFVPDAAYRESLAARAAADRHLVQRRGPAAGSGMIDGSKGKHMVHGPALSHSVSFTSGNAGGEESQVVARAMIVRVSEDVSVCFDLETLGVAAAWRGAIADTSKTHLTSFKGTRCLRPGGPLLFQQPGVPGWAIDSVARPAPADALVFHGHAVHAGTVVLSYDVAARSVLESPGAGFDSGWLLRRFEIGRGHQRLFCRIGGLAGASVESAETAVRLKAGERSLQAQVSGAADATRLVGDSDGTLWLEIAPSAQDLRLVLAYAYDSASPPPQATPVSLAPLLAGGPRQWPQVLETDIVTGDSVNGYAADRFELPAANPWGSWMRPSAIDFFPDGQMALATLPGDVWIAKQDPGGRRVQWSRFASGIYEPLGLRIVENAILVRARDRILRLHDRNGDGEADFHETFYREPGEIGTGYHAFIFELQTDRAGNLYYAKSGRKTLHPAAVVRVSPDGRQAQAIAGDLRHPNGLGVGGPKDWLTVADNPSGRAVYNGFALVREGASFGYEKPRNTPMFVVLPAHLDASSGSQCWTDPQRWGPLGGSILHTSYSHCSVFYVMTQDVAPYPNGFAVRLPFDLQSGVMRARVNPVDGQVYTVGLQGWDTKSRADGCVYRIRYTGDSARLVTGVEAHHGGLRLTFSCDLDPTSIAGGILAFRAGDKGPIGAVPVTAVTLRGRNIVDVAIPGLPDEVAARRTTTDAESGYRVVNVLRPIGLEIAVRSADGFRIEQSLYATVNSLP